jgi:hypothetical protein
MTEAPEEFRRRVEDIDAKFYEQVDKRGEPHRARSFEYEKLAVEYSHRGLQLLTYLNGGALVAIPTALAFLVPHTGHASCTVCGDTLEYWVGDTHLAIFELVRRADESPQEAA